MDKYVRGGRMLFHRKFIAGLASVLFLWCLFLGSESAFATFTSLKAAPIVETHWLEENLDRADLRIFYMDDWPSKKTEFENKHVPGSVYIGVGTFMGILGNGSTPPDKEKYEDLMGGLGVTKDDYIVVYGWGGKNPFTLSLFWLLEYFGHEKVSYLNGGLEKWNKENRKATGEATKTKKTTYKAKTVNKSMWVNADYVLENLKNSNVSIVDARGTGEYTGKVNNENNKRTGYIPGAKDLGYYVTNFNEDGTLKSSDDLKATYEAKGITKDKEVISYCQGGVKAANDYFTLKHILGYKNVKVYVGSWGEWGNRLDFKKYPAEQ